MTRTDFELRTAANAVIGTYGAKDLAIAAAQANADTYPGLRLERVTTTVTVTRQPIRWETRLQLVGTP